MARQRPAAGDAATDAVPDDPGSEAREARAASEAAIAQQIIDATYRLVERTGNVDPTMRDILAEAGLSTPAFYRQFASKDDLFVRLLADGRERLLELIEHRMAKQATGAGQLQVWTRSVLAQAANPVAAVRTRPFLANLDRLVERYPEEHRAAERMFVAQLVSIIEAADDLHSPDPALDALAIYHVVFGALMQHLRYRTTPRPGEVDGLAAFAVRALQAPT